MCSSGAHYMDWDEIEELKKEEVKVDPKYICNYSGLPSILIYKENETLVKRRKRNNEK
tara:strand:- start:381 stop:554 length:174 start_codon:yes stop_codon:yes gene_type:complete